MTTQVYKEPVQLYVMPRNRALNIEPLDAGRTPLKVADGNALLFSILEKAEELSLDIKAWIPALTKDMSKDEAKSHKQWPASTIRELISSNSDITFSYVVFLGNFGPYPAILEDDPTKKLTKEVIDL